MAEIIVRLGAALGRSCRWKPDSASSLPALQEKYSVAEVEDDRLLSSLYVCRPMPGVTGMLGLLVGSSSGSILVASKLVTSLVSMPGLHIDVRDCVKDGKLLLGAKLTAGNYVLR